MKEIKYCQKCGKKISDINTADYFSHISIKYCRECAAISAREKNTAWAQAARKRKRELNKQRDIQNDLLKEENELLRKNIIALREALENRASG